MIRALVRTEIVFKDKKEFDYFLSTDEVAKVTGFAEELKKAYESKTQMSVVTPRPKYGTVTTSYIEVVEIPE